jgi:hypothetical protein
MEETPFLNQEIVRLRRILKDLKKETETYRWIQTQNLLLEKYEKDSQGQKVPQSVIEETEKIRSPLENIPGRNEVCFDENLPDGRKPLLGSFSKYSDLGKYN